MKKLIISLVLVFIGLSANSQERILSYDIIAAIEKDGTLLVQEQIRVAAEGNAIKRGIYRTFPTKYKDRLGNRYKVGFEVTEVLKNGVPEPWFTRKESNGVIVYIGDENVILEPGVYNYSLSFRTNRQLGFFDGYDELYYNAIGGDWAFPIETATVTLILPEGAKVLSKAAFSGYAGSSGCDCLLTAERNMVSLAMTRTLQPGEQLTIAVGWPVGHVIRPTVITKIAWFLKDNLHILIALAGIAGVIMLYFRRWKSVGKDPAKGTIIPLFDPPEGFSPADTGYLVAMGMKEEVLTAALVNMAVKGCLKIVNTKKKYSLELIPGNTAELTPEEKVLASVLFSSSQELVLDNENYQLLLNARMMAEKMLKAKMIPEYFNLNAKHLMPGVLLSIALVVLSFVISPSPLIPVILIILLTGLVILFSWLIKAPTVRGRALMDEAEGFKMYLSVAEKDRLNFLHEPELTVERFESLLPYAIALGVENEWGNRFENALKRSMQETKDYEPAWYVGTIPGTAAFSPSHFTSTMGKSFSSAISSASTPPGSSSGSGGVGSAGGGGGGGGGGGW